MKSTTLIAYIPALHQGYIHFFKNHFGSKLYVLDTSLVNEFPRMDRDIRAISPELIRKTILALDIFSEVKILNQENIKKITEKSESVIMPDEDISRHIAEKYLKKEKIQYTSIFLRWDKQISTKEFEVVPQRVISVDDFDKEIMVKALFEAEKSSDWWRQIGALAVKDKKILLSSHNRPLPSDNVHNIFGDPRSNFDAGVSIELSKFIHAEAGLIAEAARQGIALKDTSIYVTTFPCPVCAKLLAVSGVKKVYYTKGYSLLDAEDILRGTGVELILVKF